MKNNSLLSGRGSSSIAGGTGNWENGRRFVPVITARRLEPVVQRNIRGQQQFCVVEQRCQIVRMRKPAQVETVVVEEIVSDSGERQEPLRVVKKEPVFTSAELAEQYLLKTPPPPNYGTKIQQKSVSSFPASGRAQHIKIIRMASITSSTTQSSADSIATTSATDQERCNASAATTLKKKESSSDISLIGGTAESYTDNGTGDNTICKVCGDGHAKLHYGVLACYGCKGFFRRTLAGKYRYVCRFGNNCIVDKYQRNSCRYCRFARCLAVGMDPKAVRPDRDLTGKQRTPRTRKRVIDEELISHMMRIQSDDWPRKIPMECRMLLIQLLNIESMVSKGDERSDGLLSPKLPSEKLASAIYRTRSTSPTSANSSDSLGAGHNVSLKELFEQKPTLDGKRTEMGYEPYRMTRPEELSKIAHRGAIAAVDWVESLIQLATIEPFSENALVETSDKITLVKACYAPLTIFNFSARTAQNTKNPDILCLCSHSYVPRKLPSIFNGSNHLSNNLVDRTLNELVSPLRSFELHEEELVLLKAIIVLNPNAKNLSSDAQLYITQLRDRVQDTLFHVVKELYPNLNPAARFGNLLLLLPTITTLSGVMHENIQFCQVFGWSDPLLNELFESETKVDESLITSTCNLSPENSSFSFSPTFDRSDVGIVHTTQPSPPYTLQPSSMLGMDHYEDTHDISTQTDSSLNLDVFCNNFQDINPIFNYSPVGQISSTVHHQSNTHQQHHTIPYNTIGFDSALSTTAPFNIVEQQQQQHQANISCMDISGFSSNEFNDLMNSDQVLSPSFVGSLLDDNEINTLLPQSSADDSSGDLFDLLNY